MTGSLLPERGYKLTRLSDVRSKKLTFLLPGRIPREAVTILAGRPGEGKSQFTLALAAQLSRKKVPSILIGAEDALDNTVRPRLLAADANTEYVHALTATVDGKEHMPTLPLDVDQIAHATKATAAQLVVIDPFTAHLDPELNPNADPDVRRAITPLARMASDLSVTVVIVSHFRKGREGALLDWVAGSVGVGGAARSVLCFGKRKDKDDDPWADTHTRYLVHVKCNGAPKAPAMTCEIGKRTVTDGDLTMDVACLEMGPDDFDIGPDDLK